MLLNLRCCMGLKYFFAFNFVCSGDSTSIGVALNSFKYDFVAQYYGNLMEVHQKFAKIFTILSPMVKAWGDMKNSLHFSLTFDKSNSMAPYTHRITFHFQHTLSTFFQHRTPRSKVLPYVYNSANNVIIGFSTFNARYRL